MTRLGHGSPFGIRWIAAMGIVLFGCSSATGAQPFERYLKGYQGPYRGRVIDAETKKPIAGAAVVSLWRREKIYILHSSTVFYEAREVLTDAEGQFVLDAEDIERNAPARTLRPWFLIFTPGYASYSGVIEARGETLEIGRLRTRQERLNVIDGLPPGEVPDEKMPNLIRLMNAERISLGLQPVHVPRGN